ncbi:hypothetical protein CJ184_001815 [Actinotignum urinale]|uniref:hypothetical protein n=2 Tax=Actinotignum urinale TaxID=190146 RepID=UPI0011AFC901|nr:hypothetical protein [Actinotignum urinale]MDY5161061.1 hypothetical protein [Actinotignum urinale]WIK59410.1 hypothetical protein CJ184_001815 [Actinotignum urinale]
MPYESEKCEFYPVTIPTGVKISPANEDMWKLLWIARELSPQRNDDEKRVSSSRKKNNRRRARRAMQHMRERDTQRNGVEIWS